MNLAVVYGGKSCEHDISVITGKLVAANLAKKHKVTEIYISKTGQWYLADAKADVADYRVESSLRLKPLTIRAGDRRLYVKKLGRWKSVGVPDCVLLCLHGLNGEDGSVQGLMELADLPYTGCGVTASGVAMDKVVTKNLLRALRLRHRKGTFLDKGDTSLRAVKALGFPLIVKPANLGSSNGIAVAHNEAELKKALDVAFRFDVRVLVEQALTDFYEVNCAVLHDGTSLKVSDLERPLSAGEILSFYDKYLSEVKTKRREFPFHCAMEAEMKASAAKIYRALNCNGVTRIDYLVDNKTGLWYVNEINTIPGSLAFYLWDGTYSFETLLEILIRTAIVKHREREKLQYAFTSEVLACPKGRKGKVSPN